MHKLTASVKNKFIAGLDLGQASDYTALAVAQCERRMVYTLPDQADLHEEVTVFIRHLQRWPLGTAYTSIVEQLDGMFCRPSLQDCVLCVDHTGVGRGVVDLLRSKETKALKRLHAISITAGDTVTRNDRDWRVPKRDLVGAVQVLLEQGRMKVAPALSHATILESELQNFKVKIDPVTAHDSYAAWRESVHDDLVLSVAMAAWHATTRVVGFSSGRTVGEY